jgi:hypothetical protein
MRDFLEPTSTGLMVLSAVIAVGVTATTVMVWDRHGWQPVRIAGPVVSFLLLGLAALIAVNLSTSLFDGWSDVVGFLR